MWFFSHSIGTKFSLDGWSVFLQDGVTLFVSDSDDLISIEGITSVGLLEVLFPDRPWDVWSSCGRPVALKSEGVTCSAVFTSGVDSECIPLTNKEVVLAFLLLALLPLALPLWVGQLRLSSGVSCTVIPRMVAC